MVPLSLLSVDTIHKILSSITGSLASTATLIDLPDEEEDYNCDVPVDLAGFEAHVRRAKAVLGPLLVLDIGLALLHVIDRATYEDGGFLNQLVVAERCTDVAGLAITTLALGVYLYSVQHHIKASGDELNPLINLGVHRTLCQGLFALVIIALITEAAPGTAYTIITHQAAPKLHTIPHISTARTVLLILTFLTVGLTRRGPKLHYTPLALGTAFGINAGETTAPPGGEPILGTPSGPGDSDIITPSRFDPGGDDPNVIDFANSSMLSFIFLFYMAPLAKKSTEVSQLLQSDLPHMEEYIRKAGADADISVDQGHIALPPDEVKITKWTLFKSIWAGRTMTILSVLCIETLVTASAFLPIWAMYKIIASLDSGTDDVVYTRLMCWALFAGMGFECIVSAYSCSRENYLLHIPTRMSMSVLVFNKILRITDVKAAEAHNLTEKENEKGKGRSQVMNIINIDVSTMAGLACRVWNCTNATFALVVGTFFLWQMFGISSLIGIACVPLSLPISYYVSRQSYYADRTWARARDARASAIKEVLQSYKVIKLNGLEPHFRKRIERLRAVEVKWQRWRFTLGTIFNILADQLPILAIFVTFFFYTKVFGNVLHPATAFVAVTVFDRVKSAIQFLPRLVQIVFNALVALNRLSEFINRPEFKLSEWDTEVSSVTVSDATISWPIATPEDYDPKAFRLRGVDVKLPQGRFTLVCGPLGAGKTLFIRALLGEATVDEGSIKAPRTALDATPINGYAINHKWSTSTWLQNSVAYAPQHAYVRHGTIRDNILFGQPMWRSRYKEALREASLLSDLELMPDGDLTEVGDTGINLSGGQKARINLARCIYSRAKTVYLDDILSAVDAHTSQYIVTECLQGKLLRGRTTVLVTHHVALCLPAADFIVSLKGGRVEQACPVSDATADELEALASPLVSPTSPSEGPRDLPPTTETHKPNEKGHKAIRQIYKAEHSSVGRVAKGHYMLMLGAVGGIAYWIIFAVLFIGQTASEGFQALYLRTWSGDPDPEHLDTHLYGYFALVTLTVGFGGCRWIWLYGIGYTGFYGRGSKVIHSRLLDVILNAPLSFFERTPKGRILNVFGMDVWRLDSQSADAFGRTVLTTLAIGMACGIVCFQAPSMLIMVLVFGIPLYWLSGVLNKLRADLRRLTSVASSPLVTLYNDAIDGVVMLRAFGSSKLMETSMQVLINRERQAWAVDWQVYNWVKGMVRLVAAIFVAGTGFALIGRGFSGAEAGFILSFAMTASQGLFGLMEHFSELEQTFVSAERINRYIEMDEVEDESGDIPDKPWPSEGGISFKQLSVRYAEDLPEVLHQITFDIKPGMRVGLVGSTGSGKSTLAMSLFRAVDWHSGVIEIDGVDIDTVKLSELRTRLNMVVQDGTLCSGTLREALDVTGEKDDYEIYEALKRVHLIPAEVTTKDLEDNPFTNLDTFVAVEGANFSHGQRQLLCLARALLKNSKVLVMDEATSSVDFEMDSKITATIKECFKGTTMLVIAHRLATIMHFDRVLVLDRGVVKEYGHPANLFQDPSSAFYSLCMAQGQEEYDRLAAIANIN